jgi:hypothetical protein
MAASHPLSEEPVLAWLWSTLTASDPGVQASVEQGRITARYSLYAPTQVKRAVHAPHFRPPPSRALVAPTLSVHAHSRSRSKQSRKGLSRPDGAEATA